MWILCIIYILFKITYCYLITIIIENITLWHNHKIIWNAVNVNCCITDTHYSQQYSHMTLQCGEGLVFCPLLSLFPLPLNVAQTLGGGQGSPPLSSWQFPQQRLSEGLAHQEVDDGVEADVERRQEERPLLHLEQQEAGGPAETRRRHLAQSVRHAGNVVRHEADEEHHQDAEDAAVRLTAHVAAVAAHAAVGFVNPAGDGGVAEDQDYQGHPEQPDAEEGGHLVPLHAQRRL